jgi:hypothetical protein
MFRATALIMISFTSLLNTFGPCVAAVTRYASTRSTAGINVEPRDSASDPRLSANKEGAYATSLDGPGQVSGDQNRPDVSSAPCAILNKI